LESSSHFFGSYWRRILSKTTSLSDEDRGKLENIIDQCIAQIPNVFQVFRTPGFSEVVGVKEESEIVLGFIYGNIFSGFGHYFVAKHGFPPKPELNEAIGNVVFNRTKEIKEAIFNLKNNR